MKKISIIMGSISDLEIVQETIDLLKEFKVGFEVKVLSAHRSPKELAVFVEDASKKGTEVFIAAAGGAAALAGVVAAHSVKPVIGAEIQNPPFSVQWDSTTVPNGAHTLSVVARDAHGLLTAEFETVQVKN